MTMRGRVVWSVGALLGVGLAMFLWPSRSNRQIERRTSARLAESVLEEMPALSKEEAVAVAAELAATSEPSEREALLARHRRPYVARILRRKLAGETISPEVYNAFLRTWVEHPSDIPPDDLRTLLRASGGDNADRTTYVAVLTAMGASQNAEFVNDLRTQNNPWAFEPYARLAGRRAIPELLRWIDLRPEMWKNGPEVFAVERAIEALGIVGDADLLPILNHVGERQPMHRPAVERALAGFNDPAAAAVAANMLSLPKAYPSKDNPDEGRWHSNHHSAARNVLLHWAEKMSLPTPSSLGEDDLRKWWEQYKGKFPDIDSIRGQFDPLRHFETASPTTRRAGAKSQE